MTVKLDDRPTLSITVTSDTEYVPVPEITCVTSIVGDAERRRQIDRPPRLKR